MDVSIVSALGLPLLMGVGGVAAWRMTKKQDQVSMEKPAWRDDSLDQWRKDRDTEAETQRIARVQSDLHEGAAAEEKAETVRHQRIGG
jgi:hypothetical protein